MPAKPVPSPAPMPAIKQMKISNNRAKMIPPFLFRQTDTQIRMIAQCAFYKIVSQTIIARERQKSTGKKDYSLYFFFEKTENIDFVQMEEYNIFGFDIEEKQVFFTFGKCL